MSVLIYKWKASLLLIIPSFFLARIMHSYWTAVYIPGTINNMFDLVVVLISLDPPSKAEDRKYVTGWWWVLSENLKHLAYGKFSKMLAITIYKWQFACFETNVCQIWWFITEEKNTLLSEEKKKTTSSQISLVCITILHI